MRPKAVLISDTHYSLSTLSIADTVWRMAVDKAAELKVPLIDAGDITNDKAILRAEVINTMINTMIYARDKGVPVYMLVGNHSLVNEKGSEHALNFLKPYVHVIDKLTQIEDIWFIPYKNNLNTLKTMLSYIPKKSTIIMHQGVTNAQGGHYIHDKTAAPSEWFKDFRVISGHYHRRQDISCGDIGIFSYVGNPYTLTFGEVHDGPKGFQVLMEDGSLTFISTNQRKHVIIDLHAEECQHGQKWSVTQFGFDKPDKEDIVWVKVRGTRSSLSGIKKDELGDMILGHRNFKLDLIPTENNEQFKIEEKLKDFEVLDRLINELPDNMAYKTYLKSLTKEIST